MSASQLNTSEEVKKEYKIWEFLVKLLPFYKQYKLHLFFVFLSLAIFTVAGRALPIVFGKAIDLGLKEKNLNYVHLFALAYLGFECTRSLFFFLQFYLSQKLSNRVLYDVRKEVVNHVQKLKIQYFDKTPVGKVLTRMTNDVNGLGDFLTQGFTGILVNIVEIISIFVTLMLLSFRLALVTIVLSPIIVVISIKLSRKIRHFSRLAKGKMSNINTHTSESISGMKVIKLYNHKNSTFKKFRDMTGEYYDHNFSLIKVFALMWPSLHLFNIVITSVTIGVGALFYTKYGLTIGTLSAFVLLLRSFFRPLRGIIERYNQFQSSLASADRIFDLLAVPIEEQTSLISDQVFQGQIELNSLNFRYEEHLPLVLKDVNLKIRNKESLAIVGRTGSGKSTMVSLLQKFYPVTDNSIFINGACINKYSPKQLRNHLIVLQQNNFIFKGSLEDNITLLNENISHETAREALKKVQCEYLLERQNKSPDPHKFIEENGSNLSLGEKQLIAFARVIAFDPDILILDEATANIDTHTERLIQAATDEITKDRTSIIIAHRLSTIVNADNILLLKNGEICEYGSHDELIQKDGEYKGLYVQQYKNAQKDFKDVEL